MAEEKKTTATKAATSNEAKAPNKGCKEAKSHTRLLDKFNNEIKAELVKKFEYSSVMQVPQLEKIVINIGVGDATQDAKRLDEAVEEIALITGQKPVITKAKKSIAPFKLREGQAIGCKVTLRGIRMYEFLDKLISIALPRVRDFRGVSKNAFDGRGNYTLGIKEQLIFPEINYDKVSIVRGMDIVVVTSAKSDEEAFALLKALGMPFSK
ncbi:MAG: 50S ribosomal protein L5 [Bacillales bacterium]